MSSSTSGASDWVETYTDDGSKYWYNTVTFETTWEDPTVSSVSTPAASVPTTALPPNWAELYTDDGVTYYYNSVTQETSWELPKLPVLPALPPEKKRAQLSKSLPPVPPQAAPITDWVETYTEDGQLYYYNSKTMETSWERPY